MEQTITDLFQSKYPNEAFTQLFWQRQPLGALGYALSKENDKYADGRPNAKSTLQATLRSKICSLAFGDASQTGVLSKQERAKTFSKMSKSDVFMALNSIGVIDEEMSESFSHEPSSSQVQHN